MATKRKRESISYEIKRDICNYAKQNPKLNNVEIGSHFGLTRTTIRDIIQKPDKYEEGGSVKHAKKGKFVDLEQALLQWFTQKRAGGVIITDLLLKEKATQLGKLMSKLQVRNYSYVDTLLPFAYICIS
jgi:transcriptional antiterminator